MSILSVIALMLFSTAMAFAFVFIIGKNEKL